MLFYLFICSVSQQGREREPSVKTIRSPFSSEYRRHCVLSGGGKNKIFNIQFPGVEIEPTTSCVYSHTLVFLRYY